MEPGKTDEQLMVAFQRGDAAAFETLVRRHRGPVFNFVLRYLGSRARAEDVLQETWLRVVRSARDYKTHARFSTWIYTIARNQCLDGLRRDRLRRPSMPTGGEEGEEDAVQQLPDPRADPEREAASLELRPMIERAIAGLPYEQREVFLLREVAGVPFKEIAEVTGVPENTVKSRMRYALESLRKALASSGVEGRTVA